MNAIIPPVMTTNISLQAVISDEILVNRDGSTAVQATNDLAVQLASTAPLNLAGFQAPLFATKAALIAAVLANKVSAWVFNDPDADNNGIWSWTGAAWVWTLPLPYSISVLYNSGAGTANAIIATSTVPLVDGLLVVLPITTTNTTSPVTVKVNQAAPLTIKTNSGNNIVVGGLVAGMVLLCVVSGSSLRLVNDQVSSAIVAAAEAAAAAAQGSAGAAMSLVDTQASAIGLSAPEFVSYFRVAGRKDIGDAGAGLFKVTDVNPLHQAKIALGGGKWGELAEYYQVDLSLFTDDINTGDASLAVQKAAEYLSYKGQGAIAFSHGKPTLSTSFDLPLGVSMIGPCVVEGVRNPSYFGRGYAHLQAMPKVRVAPACLINLKGANAIRGLTFVSTSLALDGSDLPAAFAGTLFNSGYTDSIAIESCAAVGFNLFSYAEETCRVYMRNLLLDTINGIDHLRAFDKWYAERIAMYGITQAGATGHETYSLRNGFGIRCRGSMGGPSFKEIFTYGKREGFMLQGTGSATLDDCWQDSPTDTDGRPLDPNSLGIRFEKWVDANPARNSTHSNLIIQRQKLYGQGTGLLFGADNYGSIIVNGLETERCNVVGNISAKQVMLLNVNQGHFWSAEGIIFNSKVAADTAYIGPYRSHRNVDATKADVNAGGGRPRLGDVNNNGVTSPFRMVNVVMPVATPVSEFLNVPDGDEVIVYVSGTGVIGDMGPKITGRKVTLVFQQDATTFYSNTDGAAYNSSFYNAANGGNFRTAGAFTATSGSSITFIYEVGTNLHRWVEAGRCRF